MKKILITTDFSTHSQYTIFYVLNLLHDTQIPCKILLLNTYIVQQTDPHQVISTNDELKRISKLGLERQRDKALKNVINFNISIEIASHMGSLNNVVMQLLRKEKIDLVAMGKNGGRHVESLSHLLKQQQCPLLITYSD